MLDHGQRKREERQGRVWEKDKGGGEVEWHWQTLQANPINGGSPSNEISAGTVISCQLLLVSLLTEQRSVGQYDDH